MYKNYFSINKNFQSSINLELDFNNELKIQEYIPTTDICDVLKKYVRSFLGKNKDRSTTLVGPYGKGKSFLLLIVSYIVSKNKDSETWINLVNKIKCVDEELYELIIELKEKKISLLPVIINSNYNNITQSFLLALNDALKTENLESIIPTTVYSVCLELLEKWSSVDAVKDGIIEKCILVNKITLDELRRGLLEYSPKAYKQFEKLYNCINIGLNFNPLISNDVVKTYSDVSNELSKNGFSGIFIIFDEFSKFIESTSEDLSRDLKLVQDMAEMCNRSAKNSQVHLCCVAHKSLSLYKGPKIDSFKTVEGRFTEVRFNRSIEENYQIISSAILKTKDGLKIANDFVLNNQNFYNEIKKLNLFDDEKIFRDIFPLNPLTTYSLIQLSELVAQNERTLFTFISDTDDNSFNYFINNDGSEQIFNVDKIYDYFSILLQKEETNYIRNIWYRCESILAKINEGSYKKIIKCLAIILMINDFDKLAPTFETISLSAHVPLENTREIIENLISKHYLRKNILNNTISFALSNTKHIDEKIEILKKTKFKNINLSSYLNLVNKKRYVIPRKYNEERKITRFFKCVFLDENEFFALNNFEQIFNENFCDGLIIKIISKDNISEKIIAKINIIDDSRVIVMNSKFKNLSLLKEELTRYACLKEIEREPNIDEITKEELVLLIEETNSDIDLLLNEILANNKLYNNKYNEENLSLMSSMILEDYFCKEPIFNNELVNKKNVSSQYQKAVNNVIDWLLNGKKNFDYSETSPENSVKTSVLDKNANDIKFRDIIEIIKKRILSSKGTKIATNEIYSLLASSPYGIRDGVIPIVVAAAISELSDNVILYFQNKEVLLNSNNLVKSFKNSSYSLVFSKGSIEQQNYLQKMIKLFSCNKNNSFRIDTINLADSIKKFFISQPAIIRSSTKQNQIIHLDDDLFEIKDLFMSLNLNPYECIYQKSKLIFKTNEYTKLYKKFEELNDRFLKAKEQFIYELISKIKETFNLDNKASLKSELTSFNKKKPSSIILDSTNKQIFDYINNESSYDDIEFVNSLSKICTNYYVEDWDINLTDRMLKQIELYKNSILNSENQKNDINSLLSSGDVEKNDPMAQLLDNNLQSVLDDFSDSISNENKVKVLINIIKKMM